MIYCRLTCIALFESTLPAGHKGRDVPQGISRSWGQQRAIPSALQKKQKFVHLGVDKLVGVGAGIMESG